MVHLGITLMFLGFAGEGFKIDRQLLLKAGEQATVGHYTVKNNGVKVTDDGQKQMITGHVAVFEDGKPIGTHVSSPMVLPQTRGTAHDRGRDPPNRSRRSLPGDAGLRTEGFVDEPAGGDQSAGELDLDRFGIMVTTSLSIAFSNIDQPKMVTKATAGLHKNHIRAWWDSTILETTMRSISATAGYAKNTGSMLASVMRTCFIPSSSLSARVSSCFF